MDKKCTGSHGVRTLFGVLNLTFESFAFKAFFCVLVLEQLSSHSVVTCGFWLQVNLVGRYGLFKVIPIRIPTF